MGFQETENVGRVLADGGLNHDHNGQQFGSALAIAWDRNQFTPHEAGYEKIGSDRPGLWGDRYMAWKRFTHHATGKKVWFATLHGPLPFETGGATGNHATTQKILDIKNRSSHAGDLTIIVGDFNSNYGASNSNIIALLSQQMDRVRTDQDGQRNNPKNPNGWHVDNIFLNKGVDAGSWAWSMGTGGSDHPLMKAELRYNY